MFSWRVSTYAQQTPVDAILDKGHVILEDLLEIDDLAKVLCRLAMLAQDPCQTAFAMHHDGKIADVESLHAAHCMFSGGLSELVAPGDTCSHGCWLKVCCTCRRQES